MMHGKLFVVSGPSGAGKSTITREIVKIVPNLYLSISATTRKMRAGERNEVDYHFLTIEEFKKNIEINNFVEHAEVHGNFYGTLKSEVDKRLMAGKNVLLEIDVQGGEQVKSKFPNAVLIFVAAPTDKELERRLRGRGTDSEEVIAKRLANSLKEMEYQNKYDYLLINDTIEKSLTDLAGIINNNL